MRHTLHNHPPFTAVVNKNKNKTLKSLPYGTQNSVQINIEIYSFTTEEQDHEGLVPNTNCYER